MHVDIKKLAAIGDGGWRMDGRGAANGTGSHSGVGYRYHHTALDDRSSVGYSEILDDETAAAVWRRAVVALAARGITIERVLTDNGSCYRSRLLAAACVDTVVTHKRSRHHGARGWQSPMTTLGSLRGGQRPPRAHLVDRTADNAKEAPPGGGASLCISLREGY